MSGHNLSHIFQRSHHLLSTVDESIGATDILFYHLHAVDACLARLTCGLVVIEEVVVVVGDFIVIEEALHEINHWDAGEILETINKGLVLQVLPIDVFRQLVGGKAGNRVINTQTRKAAHSHSLHVSFGVAEIVQLEAVVNH